MTLPEASEVVERLKELEREKCLRARARRRTRIWISRFLLVAAVLLLWEFGADRLFNGMFSSRPSEITKAFFQLIERRTFAGNLAATAVEVVAGYAIGVAAGIVAALAFALSRRAYLIVLPFVQAFYGIPKVALAPIFVMWFGLGTTPKVVISAIMSFFVVFVNTSMGISVAKVELLNIARVMGASFGQIIRKIMIPSALPYTVTAMRVATANAVLGAVLGEFVAAYRGIGLVINRASTELAPDVIFAGVFILTCMTLLLSSLLIPLEKWLAKWKAD